MGTIIKNKEDTENFIDRHFNKFLETRPQIILLNGEIGAGKTFFSNIFINYFLKYYEKEEIQVKSPTFNIVKTYDLTKDLKIYHFDLYRIKKTTELYELDIENAFENICLIEWPDLIRDIIPYNLTEINIDPIDSDSRLYTLL